LGGHLFANGAAVTSLEPAACRELVAGRSLLAGRSGRGVTVAIIDSGVNLAHPHIGGVAGAVAIADDGRFHADVLDRLGHGTAVAAAIHEKAPSADLFVVKVFEETLSTSLEALILALDTAAEHGARLVNLSLGTANQSSAASLAAAVDRARARKTIVVSAAVQSGRVWFPGSLPEVLGVAAERDCPRDSVRLSISGRLMSTASPYARPIPGVPPDRNLNGVSFAVANTTGLLACMLEDRPELDSATAVAALARSVP
jgi:subtilisin family serine protease